MNRSLVSLSLSSRITFYLLRAQRSGETTTTATVQTERKRRNRENLLLLRSFRNDWFAWTSSASKAEERRREREEKERRKRGDRKAGVTSLETRSVKRDTRVANNRGAKRRGEERGGGKSVRRRKTWTRFNGAFKFFRFFLEGEGEGNNWGRKGIDPGEER